MSVLHAKDWLRRKIFDLFEFGGKNLEPDGVALPKEGRFPPFTQTFISWLTGVKVVQRLKQGFVDAILTSMETLSL